ncbi:MAG: hypothetical protein F2MM_01245 [Candidatus Midichloria mitochondrii]
MVSLVEIFCLIDDFCKQQLTYQRSLRNSQRQRERESGMMLSEVITILVLFHLRALPGFKDFYLNCVQISLREGLPKLISYNRFVELMRDAVIPLVILLNCCKGKQTGTLTQQKAGRFVVTYVLAVIRSLKASLAKQFLGRPFFSGLLAYVFKNPVYLMENRLAGLLLTSN